MILSKLKSLKVCILEFKQRKNWNWNWNQENSIKSHSNGVFSFMKFEWERISEEKQCGNPYSHHKNNKKSNSLLNPKNNAKEHKVYFNIRQKKLFLLFIELQINCAQVYKLNNNGEQQVEIYLHWLFVYINEKKYVAKKGHLLLN